MAKKQTFGDKSKGKAKVSGVMVKVVKGIKSDTGSIKFSEKLVRLDDVSQVSEIK